MISHKDMRKVKSGHFDGNEFIDSALDGCCASACVVAAFNVTKCGSVSRKASGCARDVAIVNSEEQEIK